VKDSPLHSETSEPLHVTQYY